MIVIRNAVINDLPAMLEIYNDIIINTTAVWQYDTHTLEMREEWFKTKQEQGFPIFVAEENGKIVGFSTFGTFRAWQGYKHTVENSVYVASDQRGKGIGKLLMPPLIEAAQQLGIHAIVAGIDGENEVSIKLHQQFGFVEVAHFKEVGFKFNKWMDLKFLELIIVKQ
ncbi:GNAT family N-acetyltransferase [Ferruginibacter albus]|uniref:GNAT family N-acetyltransferase n=1 Tax=Ferruginibacter albus TaxID=2875540 RepID=UPI001CC389CF|nr:GNAT family N-acetyltransferase [Ferruginibacter albus]UAY50787.1 GNAT family N-acetyltransferase [Ferruginibacter albus]